MFPMNLCRELLKETANLAATLAQQSEGVAEWEDWWGEQDPVSSRSEAEEKYL